MSFIWNKAQLLASAQQCRRARWKLNRATNLPAPYRVPMNYRINLMGYPQYGARQVLDSKANEQGCWGLCRKKSNRYASLRRKRRSFADYRLSSGASELDLTLNGHQPW